MWRQSCEKHGGNVPGFTVNVTRTFRNDAMLRQISESVQTTQVQQDQLIITASAHGHLYSPQFPSHQEIKIAARRTQRPTSTLSRKNRVQDIIHKLKSFN